MRGRFFFLMIVVILFSCEDPTTLPVSKVFNGNRLGTIYVDTFSVMTSTVQMDSVLTNGTQTVLLGKYRDDSLGYVSASSYFQMCYLPYGNIQSGSFIPDVRSRFDSVSLIMHYNHTYSGDTTKPVTINLYQLSELMNARVLPGVPAGEIKIPTVPFAASSGFYNNTKFHHYPTPIFSATVSFKPHTDSLYIKLPSSFAANWFRLAQVDSFNVFSNPNKFLSYFFYGAYMDVDPATDACVVGFKTKNMKIRFYYHQLNGDLYQATHRDFNIVNPAYQFNHIEYDRSVGSRSLASAPKLTAVPTRKTGNYCYVQSGTGVVARLDFPSLKGFFAINSGIVLSAAYLDIYPVQGTYSKDFSPPDQLSLYPTDGSNLPLPTLGAANVGSAKLNYDLEFGNTFYRFQFFPYLFGQLKSGTNYVTSVILAPSVSEGNSVQRMYFGDRYKIGNKIKLRIYYTTTLN